MLALIALLITACGEPGCPYPTFGAGFAIKRSRKDVATATKRGREFDVPVPLGATAEQRLVEALNRARV
jgi:3-hydroxyisobutyrate dehydrogenase-like beta-hydroxyacid dehydrogenase